MLTRGGYEALKLLNHGILLFESEVKATHFLMELLLGVVIRTMLEAASFLRE